MKAVTLSSVPTVFSSKEKPIYKMNFKKTAKPFLELAARIYVFLMLTTYGLGKMAGGQFYRRGKIPEEIAGSPLSEVGSFDLAWTFFGYSEYYIYFIGGSQVLGSIMLLFEKTKLLGVAVLIPILLNIIVVDYCFQISNGAMMSAIGYFLALCFVLYCNRQQVMEVLQMMLQSRNLKPQNFKQKAIRIGVALAIVATVILLENQMLNIVGR